MACDANTVGLFFFLLVQNGKDRRICDGHLSRVVEKSRLIEKETAQSQYMV